MSAPADRNGDFLIGPDYRPAPELSKVAGLPSGSVQQFVMESKDSSFYPGVARDVFGTRDPNNPRTLKVETHPQSWERAITVYIPAGYKAGTSIPFIVVHDGPKLGDPDMSLPQVLDNLIAQHRVPPMVAILIQNGGGDAQGSERGLEYDTLSHDPDARAAMGCSSGAAAAFTMAWFHPEWYHRVISYSGTFVNQQWPFNPDDSGGAWDYHERLIPGSPAKPIRSWMQVGDRDLHNPNIMLDDMHDWVIANPRRSSGFGATIAPNRCRMRASASPGTPSLLQR
jgi:iron(III)-enterobactin esterase